MSRRHGRGRHGRGRHGVRLTEAFRGGDLRTSMPMVATGRGGDRRPIAMFDSGVGGLTVLHECLVSLPEEDFFYFGDTARFPYGRRAPNELREFTSQVARYLLTLDPKLLVVACNSATAAALPHLRSLVDAAGDGIEVVGVVEPESEVAAAVTRVGRIGVLATPATVGSGAYERATRALDPGLEVKSVACGELASNIQNGMSFDEATVEQVRSYCEPLKRFGVDTVILGCTHFPLMAPMIQRILGRNMTLVSSGHAVAAKIQRVLERNGMATGAQGEGMYSFICSGDTGQFQALGTRFLQMPLGEVRHADIAQLEAMVA